jgi:flagellar protein FliO/FliZ
MTPAVPVLLRGAGLAAVVLALGTATLAAAEPAPVPAPGQLLIPRASAAPAPVAGRPETGWGPAAGVAALTLAAAGGWLCWRFRRDALPGGRAERRLAVMETRSLGNRQFLVVAAYDRRKFLLGVCPGRIDLLAPLDDGPPSPPA